MKFRFEKGTDSMYRYNMPGKYQALDGHILKIIACVTMLIDHAAVCLIYHMLYKRGLYMDLGLDINRLSKTYDFLRAIGRTAFPIYCFLLVEGFCHTKSRLKYALRLLIFGFISEIPFNLCLFGKLWDPKHNNVYFTLFIGLLVLWAWEELEDKWYIQLPFKNIRLYARYPICLALGCAAGFLHTDYGWKGILLIFILYLMHAWRIPQVFFGLASMYWELPGVILGFIPLLFYNGKRGRQLKYFFYVFYPGHLLLLYLLSVYLVDRI